MLDNNELLDLARTAACLAGEYLSGEDVARVDSMAGKDIKLEADKASEALILEVLGPSGLPVLTEESGSISGKGAEESGLRWIIDPLDGSMNYYKGLRELCCVSVALWDNETPVLGVVNRFAMQEIFEGIVGESASLNGEPIRANGPSTMDQAVLATGFPLRGDSSEAALKRMEARIIASKKVRMLGAAALMSVFVACGRADVYCEYGIMLWDIAASAAIVQAAGGVVLFEDLDDFRCDIKCFSSHVLMEDFCAQGL